MTYGKKIILVLVTSSAIAAIIPALLVIYVDPFQIYHRAFIPKMGLSENQRYQNAGLINSYLRDPSQGYDSIALGTSMSANITSERIHSLFGWNKTVRLFTKGGGSREVTVIAERAIESGNVKHVLWEINPWNSLESYQLSLANEDFPTYLYDDSFFNDLRYVFNIDSLRLSIEILQGDMSSNDRNLEDIGTTLTDDDRHFYFNEVEKEPLATGSIAWHPLFEKWPKEKRESLSFLILDKDFYPVIDNLCNKDIEVVFYIPPYSKLQYAEQHATMDDIYAVIYMPRKILHRISSCKNMRLHAFDLMSFTADINYYRDFMHYTALTNDGLLELMAQRKQEITLDTIDHYEDAFIDQLNSHRIYTTYPAAPAPLK